MVFVELLRLVVAVGGALAGLAVAGGHGAAVRSLDAGLGVLVGYVAGGVLGRFAERGVTRTARSVRSLPPVELLAGLLLGGIGILVGVLACLPLLVLSPAAYDYAVTAAVALVFGELGLRLGMAKGHQLAEGLGLSRRLWPEAPQVGSGALLADASALLDRGLAALARAGLVGELLVPEAVVDEVRTLAAGPDPVASRRARRALEHLEALRAGGVTVSVVPGDPALEEPAERMVALVRRTGARVATASAAVTARLRAAGLPVLDLRELKGELAPEHVAGERLRVDLVRAGRQPGQAVGYLPDGDMVVVNEAEHLVGTRDVEVVVLSSRPTSQGVLVFARVLNGAEDGEPEAPVLRRP
jgi:uncharacterized protein YacL